MMMATSRRDVKYECAGVEGPLTMTSPISFGHALAAQAVLDLAEDGAEGHLDYAMHPAMVDYVRVNGRGAATCIVRGMTGPAPYTVLSGDLWSALRRWTQGGGSDTGYVFHTDGSLFPSAVTAVADRLDRFAAGVESEEDRLVVQVAGIDVDSPVLRRVQILARSGGTAKIVEDIVRRVAALQRRRGDHAGSVDATIDRLLRRFARDGSGSWGGAILYDEARSLAGVDASDARPLSVPSISIDTSNAGSRG
jgi:hypothetical protein